MVPGRTRPCGAASRGRGKARCRSCRPGRAPSGNRAAAKDGRRPTPRRRARHSGRRFRRSADRNRCGTRDRRGRESPYRAGRAGDFRSGRDRARGAASKTAGGGPAPACWNDWSAESWTTRCGLRTRRQRWDPGNAKALGTAKARAARPGCACGTGTARGRAPRPRRESRRGSREGPEDAAHDQAIRILREALQVDAAHDELLALLGERERAQEADAYARRRNDQRSRASNAGGESRQGPREGAQDAWRTIRRSACCATRSRPMRRTKDCSRCSASGETLAQRGRARSRRGGTPRRGTAGTARPGLPSTRQGPADGRTTLAGILRDALTTEPDSAS